MEIMNQEEKDILRLENEIYTHIYSVYFRELPIERKTPNVCRAAIKRQRYNLAEVPPDLRSQELCEYTLDCFSANQLLEKLDYELLKYFSPFPDLYLKILKKFEFRSCVYHIVESFTPSLITPEVATEAVRQNFRCIALLPQTCLPKITKQEREDIKQINSIEDFKALPVERKTEAVCYAEVLRDYHSFYYIPEKVLSDRIIIQALQYLPPLFTQLKDQFKTEAVCIAAINRYPDHKLIFEIPPASQTEQVIITALEYQPFYISVVDKTKLTKKMCLSAIESNRWALLEIPPDIRTREMYYKAVKELNKYYDAECFKILKHIPDPEVCLSVLEEYRNIADFKWIYSLIEPTVIDWNISMFLVSQDTKYYKLLPAKFKTQISQTELKDIQDIKQSSKHIFPYLPEARKTEIVSYAAIDKNYKYIVDVPETVMTERIITTVLKQNGDFLSVIPPAKRTENFYIIAIQNSKDGSAISNFPPALLNVDNCMAAVKQCGYALKYIPDQLKNEEMCRTAFKSVSVTDFSEYILLASIPFASVCLEKIKAYYEVVDIFDLVSVVPPQAIDKNIAEFCVGINGNCISKIPPEVQTKEILVTAIQASGPTVLLNSNISKDLLTDDIHKLINQLNKQSDPKYKITANLKRHLQNIIPYPSRNSRTKSIK